jgi:hypothetical protein
MTAAEPIAAYIGRRRIGQLKETATGFRCFDSHGREIEGERTLIRNALRAVAEAAKSQPKIH